MSAEGINGKIISLVVKNNFDKANSSLATSLYRLSSGLQVSSFKDNPGSAAIALRFSAQINSLSSASRNVNDGISMAQMAEGATNETLNLLQRARELAVQSANGTNTSLDRQSLQLEVDQIKGQISNIASGTSFNQMNLLDGSLSLLSFQIGANPGQNVAIPLANMQTTVIGANKLTTSNIDGIRQANYGVYKEANGSSINVNAGLTNGIVASSTIRLTPVNTDGTAGTTTTVTPIVGSTASQLASAINSTSLAQASAFTAVKLTNFTIAANGNSITIGINTTNGVNVAGPVLDSTVIGNSAAQTYTNVATAINANANMQNKGVYAIASATGVTVVSPDGYDVTATATGTATLGGMQILDNSGNNIGSNTALAAGNSITAVGILSLELKQNVNVAFGDNKIFNNPTTIYAGVYSSQTTNRLTAQTITVAGNQGSANINLTANASAASVATAINYKTGNTGVSASASTTAVIQGVSASGTVRFNLKADNNVVAAISASVTTTDITGLVQAINNVSGSTGITAQTNGSNASILLTAQSGNDIQILNFSHSAAVTAQTVSVAPLVGDGNGTGGPTVALPSFQSIQVLGNIDNTSGQTVTLYSGGGRNNVNSTVVGGEVTFSSTSTFSVSSNVDGVSYSGSLFQKSSSANSSSTFSSVADLSISSSSDAQNAITTLDQAISQVTQMSARFGAAQSRFDSQVRLLSDNISSLQQAKSAIVNVDVAMETSKLIKWQITAQASIAMLAQSHSMQKDVLSLLSSR